MKVQNMPSSNEVTIAKPTSQRSMGTEVTKPITEESMSAMDINFESSHSQSQKPDEKSKDCNEVLVQRRPPQRNTTMEPYKQLPKGWRVQFKWPPASAYSVNKKASTKLLPYCPKSISTEDASLSPSSELSSLTDRDNRDESDEKIFGKSQRAQRRSVKDKIDTYASTLNAPFSPSRPERSPGVMKLISPLSSRKDRDGSGKTSIGSSLRSIKDKIDHYESFRHRNSFSLSSDAGFDLLSPTMKLRGSHLGETSESSDYEYAEMIASVPLSPNYTLPRPVGCKKHPRVSYRITFGIPDLEGEESESADDHDRENKNDSVDEAANTRGGGIRGIHGYNRCDKWVSWDESGPHNDETNPKSNNSEKESDVNYTVANEQAEKGEVGSNDFRSYRHPAVWITPIKSEDGSPLWIAKRVWDIEDRDDEEHEYLIDHLLLMHGIRDLMGIPENEGMTPGDWQVYIDESDPWEKSAEKDSAPKFPSRSRGRSPHRLYVKRVVDIDGQDKASSNSVLLDQKNCYKQLKHSAEFWQHKNDSDCDASLNDYFNGSDNSSVSISLDTEKLYNSYSLSSDDELERHNENEEKNLSKNSQEESGSSECRPANLKTDCNIEKIYERIERKYGNKKKVDRRRSKALRKMPSPQVIVKTTKVEYFPKDKKDSNDKYVRGTPTWEKKSIQQSEDLLHIKPWWES